MQETQIILVTLVVYKLTLIAIGLWASRRTKTLDDFFLAGRGLGGVVAALSYSSSAASAWVLMGLTGVAYAYGVSTIWVPLGAIIGMLVVWYWIAPRLSQLSHERRLMTLTDVLVDNVEKSAQPRIKWVASAIIVFSFVFYVAAQFQAAGTTFSTTFNMPMLGSIVLGAAIILIYTLLGGFWAVSITDALQGLLMFFTALTMPIVAYVAIGGFDGLLAGLEARGEPMRLSFTAQSAFWTAAGIVAGGLSIGFGTFGQPHLMARVMALKDTKALRQARTITIVWYIAVYLGMWFVGIVGQVLHDAIPDRESIFFVMLDAHLPVVVGAIMLAAVLSAIMSTADSQLLAAAAALAHDLGLAGDTAHRFLWVSRLAVVALVVLAVCVAITMPDEIFSRVLFAWMALGAAFGPSLFACLLGIGIKPSAMLLSIVSGFGLTVLFSLFPNTPGDVLERLLPVCIATLMLALGRNRRTDKGLT